MVALVLGQGGVGNASHDGNMHACMKDSKDGTTAKLKRFVSDPALCDTNKEQVLEWDEDGIPGADLVHSPFARTTVDGAAAAAVGNHSAITVGTDGNPVISYHRIDVDSLHVVRCNDPACVGGDETISEVDPDGGSYTSIAIGADGNPFISYVSTFGEPKVVDCNDPACAPGGETISFLPRLGSAAVGNTAVVIGTNGNPVVAYGQLPSGTFGLEAVACNDPACSGDDETATQIDISGEFVSMTLGADGNPIMSYYMRGNDELRVAACNDPQCASRTVTTVADSGGLYTSIAIGLDGNPIVSYWHTGAGLLLARCNDPDCDDDVNGTENIIGLDALAGVGPYSSLAVGWDGNPVVSYYDDSTDHDLKVLHCNVPACTSLTKLVVDSVGDVGKYSSLTIGADHNPVISYFAATNSDLKVIHCSSIACTPFEDR